MSLFGAASLQITRDKNFRRDKETEKQSIYSSLHEGGQDVLYVHSSSSLRMTTVEEYIFSSTFF